MSCGCITYTCLGIAPRIFQCGEDIVTTLAAASSGLWMMKYEFNGIWFGEQITVTEGTFISLPNVFNETYKHTIKLYDSAGELVNDTCYTLNMADVMVESAVTSPASGGSVGQYITVTATETSEIITVPQGLNIWIISPGNQSWVRNVDFTQSGDEVTLINGSNFTDGDTYLMMYL